MYKSAPLLLLLPALLACAVASGPASRRLFFIFEWPSDLQSSWPEPGTTLVPHPGRTPRPLGYKHDQGLNFGAGQLLNGSYGLYSTNYFHLYHLIMSRLRVHPLRTYNRSEATLFVAPVDVGIMAQWNKHNGQYRMHQKMGGSEEAARVCALMRQDIQRTPLMGHDVLLINSLFNIFNTNISKIFFECANCTVINHDCNRGADNYHYKYTKANGVHMASAFFGVPYLSAIHWHQDIAETPWRSKQERPIPVAFWASVNVQNPHAAKLRRMLRQACEARSDRCADMLVSDRHAEPCYSQDTANCLRSAASKSDSLVQRHGAVGLELYRLSQYCLQPPGDMDGRKALSDSILLGCIPVFFNAHLLSQNYPWFFSLEDEREAALYIPWQSVVLHNDSFNFVDYISSIPPEVTRRKQAALALVAERTVYSVPPADLSDYIGFGGAPGARNGASWAPPFHDAVDLILEKTFDRIERFKRIGMVPDNERVAPVSGHALTWLPMDEAWRAGPPAFPSASSTP